MTMNDRTRKDDGYAGIWRMLRSALLFVLVATIAGAAWYFSRDETAQLRQTVHELLVYIGAEND
jgi:hypothetical protein